MVFCNRFFIGLCGYKFSTTLKIMTNILSRQLNLLNCVIITGNTCKSLLSVFIVN